jgi:hypothetical protein
MKDYSKALGLLAVAQTPIFLNSFSTEFYVLKMLILRELCPYESVLETASEVRSDFNGVIQKPVDQKRRLRGHFDSTHEPTLKISAIVNNFHSAPAQNK